MDNLQIIHSIWPEWSLTEKALGVGSYGTVYRARRTKGGQAEYTAIKISKVPRGEAELRELQMENLDTGGINSFIEDLVRDMTKEIRLMESVKGSPNIVPILDHEVYRQSGSPYRYILIRMPLLTPLDSWKQNNAMGEAEVVRLGLDLCQALIRCRRKNIVHRDIKPENIFVDSRGTFMLGDFGVARTLDRLTTGMTTIGSYNYMAPELFNHTLGKTDISRAALVDIYSLGMVLYRLTNRGLLPFLTASTAASSSARDDALLRRMGGAALPAPSQASPELARVILRACAFDPKDRWPSAQAMYDALASLKGGEKPAPAPAPNGGKLRKVLLGIDIAAFSLAMVLLVIIIILSTLS